MLPPEFLIHLQGPEGGPLPVDFETLAERLQRLPRMYFEWDGSWVWTGELTVAGSPTSRRWQLDGMVYDAAGVVQYIELKGTCPWAAWQKLIAACGSFAVSDAVGNSGGFPTDAGRWTVTWVTGQELWELPRFQQTFWGGVA